MSNVRLRRLQSDFERLSDFAKRHPRLQIIQADGEPPERYQLEYRIRSLRQKDDELQEVKSHLVEIMLPRNYPRTPPQCRMLTPIFHPNIAPHAICIGDHWSAGATLDSVVGRIGEMIAYQSYNTKSPLNGEAARWVDQNLHLLPLDPVSMTVEEVSVAAANGTAIAPAPRPVASPAPAVQHTPVVSPGRNILPPPLPPNAAPPPSPVPVGAAGAPTIEFRCPQCSSPLRVRADAAGKRVRCPRCQTVAIVPSNSQ
ncbi:MAG TPA: ubiquitin-conjugating enzyme E2 [Pirellulales bacterium]|nr:ubiquitin-conjugating enzyme E2 [Pirellulales bacterium]